MIAAPSGRRRPAGPADGDPPTGSASSPAGWPSCAAGSPATTRSTTSASTPTSPTTCCCRRCGRSTTSGSASRRGPRQRARRRRRARRRQPLRHDPGRRADDDARRCSTTTRRTATCGCSAPTWSSACRSSARIARKGGNTLACNADAERLLDERRAGRRLPRGLQGHRQAVQRALQAAAVRPRRLRLGGAAHRDADHPVLDRRGRGDLPDDRQRQDAGAAARPAVPPDHADVPAARPARRWCRCRRSGSSSSASRSRRRPRARRRPRTRCWSSTSPTRCARRSSRPLYTLLMQRRSVFV